MLQARIVLRAGGQCRLETQQGMLVGVVPDNESVTSYAILASENETEGRAFGSRNSLFGRAPPACDQ